MKKSIFIAIFFASLMMQSCYISKYKDLKKNYETLRKKSSEENSKLAKVKQTYRQKDDSVQNLKKENIGYIKNYIKADSIIDSICRYIENKKNLDFSKNLKLKSNSVKNNKSYTDREKELYYYLNLARNKPSLYVELYVKPCMNKDISKSITVSAFSADTSMVWYYSYYQKSLYLEMKKMEPAGILTFNDKCRESAECHAITTGKLGLITHDRTPDCKSYFSGECCFYGGGSPEYIITELLIDTGVPSLGHRFICLSPSFSSLGVAIRDHKSFGKTAVLDFQ
jgi:hypothetical protein